MFVVVFSNGKRLSFESSKVLLTCVLINCPSLTLSFVKIFVSWLENQDDFSPFLIDDYKLYVLRCKNDVSMFKSF